MTFYIDQNFFNNEKFSVKPEKHKIHITYIFYCFPFQTLAEVRNSVLIFASSTLASFPNRLFPCPSTESLMTSEMTPHPLFQQNISDVTFSPPKVSLKRAENSWEISHKNQLSFCFRLLKIRRNHKRKQKKNRLGWRQHQTFRWKVDADTRRREWRENARTVLPLLQQQSKARKVEGKKQNARSQSSVNI